MKRLSVLLGLAWAALAMAQPAETADDVPTRLVAERDRLAQARAAIEQEHDLLQRECWQRFAVNGCLREVRRKRHLALDPLRQQELELNAQERAWRTQQREERLRDKQEPRERQP